MTQESAVKKAQRLSCKNNKEYHVVYERGDGFQVATDYDLDTYYYGARVVATAYGNDIYCSYE